MKEEREGNGGAVNGVRMGGEHGLRKRHFTEVWEELRRR